MGCASRLVTSRCCLWKAVGEGAAQPAAGGVSCLCNRFHHGEGIGARGCFVYVPW